MWMTLITINFLLVLDWQKKMIALHQREKGVAAGPQPPTPFFFWGEKDMMLGEMFGQQHRFMSV